MKTRHLYSFGPFRVDSAKRLLERDQKAIPLPPKAFEALLFLIRNHDRLVKKDELMSTLWPDTTVEENNLSQSISAIRKALGDSPQQPQYIATVPGWGYRFSATVRAVSEESLVSPPASIFPVTRSRRGSWHLPLAIVLILILIAAEFLHLRRTHNLQPIQTVKIPSTLNRKSIAIVRFDNLSEKKKDAWLSTALAEMLNTELAAGGTLRVVSGTDLARAKIELPKSRVETPSPQQAQELEREIGADFLVYGSYVAIEEQGRRQLRFDIRLKNAKSGEMIAEIAEAGAASDLFDLVSRAGLRLRQRLGFSDLSPTETAALRASMPANPKAAEAYAEGVAGLRVFDAVRARDKFQQSIAFDPNYPMSHSALADAWSKLGYDSKRAEEARKAFQLSKNLSSEEKLLVEARYRAAIQEWPKAVEIYGTLTTMFPDNLDYGLSLAESQTESSNAKGALQTLDRLRSLPAGSGNDPRIGIAASTAWYSLGDFKQMHAALEESVANSQASGHRLLLASAKSQLCFVWRFLGETQKAMDACGEAQQIYIEAGDRGGEANTLRLLGDLFSASDVRLSLENYEKALAIEKETGDIWGTATVLNQMAIVYSDQGNHVAAENSFEQILRTCRILDKKVSSIGMMINISSELAAQGKLKQSRATAEKTFRAADELGNKEIQGLAANNMAAVDRLRGELDKAQRGYEQARGLLDSAQDKTQMAESLTGLGAIAMAKGDFDTARNFYDSALSIRNSATQKIPTAESQLDLAVLSFVKGESPAELESRVRDVMAIFSSQKAINDEVYATDLLARILDSQGHEKEALAAAESAIAASAKADPNYRLSAETVAIPLRVANHRTTTAQAIANIEKAILTARRMGYVQAEMEAMLALGKLQVKSGLTSLGRARLNDLQKKADLSGFAAIARESVSAKTDR